MKFAVGADHAGVNFRERLIEYLRSEGHKVEDFGTDNDESCDYPEFAHPVAREVSSNSDVRGLLVCGSGQGMVMTANRYPNVRAALCLNGEMARKTREHNNANCLVLAERMMDYDSARDAIDQFISTGFDGGRHARRIGKIDVPPLKVSTNSLLQSRITELRRDDQDYDEFHVTMKQVTSLLFSELSQSFPTRNQRVQTPIKETVGKELKHEYIVTPIIRAGLGMVDAVREVLPEARVAHLGFSRDEDTYEAEEYYRNIPEEISDSRFVVLDPMLATGGTATKAIKAIREHGYEGRIHLLCVVAAPEGVETVHENHESVSILTGALDEGLNDQNYIVPGLGDAGDRIYGTGR